MWKNLPQLPNGQRRVSPAQVSLPPRPQPLTREDVLTNADVYVPPPPPPDEDPTRCAILTCQHQHLMRENRTHGPCTVCVCLHFVAKVLPGETVIDCLIRLEQANQSLVVRPVPDTIRVRRLGYFKTPPQAPAIEWYSSIMRLLACCQDTQLVKAMDA